MELINDAVVDFFDLLENGMINEEVEDGSWVIKEEEETFEEFLTK